MVQRSSLLLLVGTLAVSGCAGEGGVTQPTPPGSAAGSPTSPDAYLESVLTIMQTASVNRAEIDWPAFRATVMERAAGARTVAEVFPAILVALQLLGDHESYVTTREGGLIGPPPVGGCGGAARVPDDLPETVGYVQIASCDCQGNAATQFAESIQQAIERADRPGLSGWIVDLRGNIGGNMWPMIAGIGPVLGEGIIGWIVYYNREYEREYRDGAALSLGEAFAQVPVPYRVLQEYPKVAVLTDGGVASAGEAVVVFFKGRPNTRSFGTPTCGHHHLQETFPLSDGSTLSLATSQHADRTKQRYGGPIAPDEFVDDPAEAGRRAIAWLQGGR